MKTIVIAITGPSGFNKSDLVKKVLKSDPELLYVIAYTDRQKREDEIDGIDFKFIDDIEFTKMVDAEKFLEWQRLLSNNHRYGKTKFDFENIINSNKEKIILTTVNVVNLPLLKRYYPELKSIFVDVKDTQSLIDFLRSSPDVISEDEFEKRMKFATEERRRRHLADITIHMKDNFDDSLIDFQNAINSLSDRK
jgi:guanylate kinase